MSSIPARSASPATHQPETIELNDESEFETIVSREGYISICGFISLLSVRSVRSTFLELINFRVARLNGFRREIWNDTLQFMRVVSGTRCWPAGFVFLTLEAADAGVMKTYQAELFMPVARKINLPCSRLNLFGHVDDNGRLSILIDKRHERITEESESDEEEMAEQDFCRYKDTFFPCTALPSCF